LVINTKSGESYAAKTLESMIDSAGWGSEIDLIRVKLIKPKTVKQRREAKESKDRLEKLVLEHEQSKQ